MKHTETYDAIEDYLQGKLNDTEKNKFETQLNTNEELFEEFIFHKKANDLILDARLQELNSVFKEKREPGKNGKKIIYALIAICLLGGGFFVTKTDDKPAEIKEKPSLEKVEVNNNKGVVTIDVIEEAPRMSKKLTKENKQEVLTAPLKNEGQVLVKEDSISIDKKLVKETSTNDFEKDTSEFKTDVNTPVFVTPLEEKDTVKKSEVIEVVKRVETDVVLADDTVDEEAEAIEEESITVEKFNLEISPASNEYDHFRFDEFDSGLLQIYSQRGSLIYQTMISEGQPAYWDGVNNSGNIDAGYYIYKFEGKRKIITGGITVIY